MVYLCAAWVVELIGLPPLFSMHAPAELKQTAGSVLGAVPHQLRGALSDFTQLKITGQAYKNCTACSEKVRLSASQAFFSG